MSEVKKLKKIEILFKIHKYFDSQIIRFKTSQKSLSLTKSEARHSILIPSAVKIVSEIRLQIKT